MTDELKPVRCGCGGEANIHKDDSTFGQMPIYTVSCNTCGMRSGRRSTEAEAVTAWNKAMGVRTAKVEKGAYDLMRCECGMPVSSNFDYCPKCRARLEWE